MLIHPTAQIHPEAEIADGVEVGAFSVVGARVKIATGTRVFNNVTLFGPTTIGKNNKIHPYSVIGGEPQDLSYKGGDTRLTIGDNNTFREYVTINRGTEKGGGETVVGNNNLIMAACHIAHDCILEDNIIMANGTLLGGHIKIETDATISGQVSIHHFVTVGSMSFIGGASGVSKDVPPFMTVQGNHAKVRYVNVVGLRRKGVSENAIVALKDAYRIIWRSSNTLSEAFAMLEARVGEIAEIKVLLDFLRRTEQGVQGRAREKERTW